MFIFISIKMTTILDSFYGYKKVCILVFNFKFFVFLFLFSLIFTKIILFIL